MLQEDDMPKVGGIAIILVCAAAGLWLTGCSGLQQIEALTVADIPFGAVRDGRYQGSQRNFPVTAKVAVTVENGKITGIELLRHFHGPGHGADEIVGRVMAKQSLQVDAVTGATYSSKVVLKAIESALKRGL
jgi:uncharacterized protein with FMN-binding domain